MPPVVALLLFLTPQLTPGPGNPQAERIAQASAMVRSAYRIDLQQIQKLTDPHLLAETHSALANPQTCIAHRARLTPVMRKQIVQELLDAQLLNPADNTVFPGGLINGVFPAVLNDNTACPHLPQPFYAAPVSTFGSHHSYPGGLAIHEANNDLAAVNWAAQYRRIYGPGVYLDENLVIAAPLWHDWAKTIVMQWNSDGTIYKELTVAGTGSHHILSLAEAMSRHLSPVFIDVQACAHSAPTGGNETKVVAWIRAAAIIARQDPIAQGSLIKDDAGAFRLPAFRQTGSFDLPRAGKVDFLAEMTIHNLSDADFVYGNQAVDNMQAIIASLAPRYQIDATQLRNLVFANYSAESLYLTYTQKGLPAIATLIDKLLGAKGSSHAKP